MVINSESGCKGTLLYDMQSPEYCGLQHRCTTLKLNLQYLVLYFSLLSVGFFLLFVLNCIVIWAASNSYLLRKTPLSIGIWVENTLCESEVNKIFWECFTVCYLIENYVVFSVI